MKNAEVVSKNAGAIGISRRRFAMAGFSTGAALLAPRDVAALQPEPESVVA